MALGSARMTVLEVVQGAAQLCAAPLSCACWPLQGGLCLFLRPPITDERTYDMMDRHLHTPSLARGTWPLILAASDLPGPLAGCTSLPFRLN